MSALGSIQFHTAKGRYDRKQALAWIRADAAKHGKASDLAIRMYCENRVSYQAFLQVVREGQAIYSRTYLGDTRV